MMTGKERISRILKRQPVDRMGLFEHFWNDTCKCWQAQGRIQRNFGDRLSLCGGIDVRNLVANDRDAIRRELAEKIPLLKRNHGYILHSDHSIPGNCDYETYKFFLEEGLRLGAY